MVASVIDVRQPGKPAFGRQGIDTHGLVISRIDPAALC